MKKRPKRLILLREKPVNVFSLREILGEEKEDV
jgi:hypothetical protein